MPEVLPELWVSHFGNVEKSRQRRSLALPKRFAQTWGRSFAVLTYFCTLRASKGLRPCWMDFFEHSLSLMLVA